MYCTEGAEEEVGNVIKFTQVSLAIKESNKLGYDQNYAFVQMEVGSKDESVVP
jgi:hypothetical protein